jgi:hypothetical protein
MMDLGFSVNQNDRDGDPWDYCVLLHIDKNVILRFEDSGDLEEFSNRIKEMLPEIRDTEE